MEIIYNNCKALEFEPLIGFASKHVQTILPVYLPPGEAPPFTSWIVKLSQTDSLVCSVSIPPNWKKTDETVVLVHGLGGSDQSTYMIRMARKLYVKGIKVVRVNLRGCGLGKGLSKLPCHGGNSDDLLKVLEGCKDQASDSPITLVGFSLGGNLVLKLSGELGDKVSCLLKHSIAICPPLDLCQSSQLIRQKKLWVYHRHYLTSVFRQSDLWTEKRPSSLYEFDDKVTAPMWGYKGAFEFYQDASCMQFIPKIKHVTKILLTEDDPFVDCKRVKDLSLPKEVEVFITKKGGHMGFVGTSLKKDDFYWMDQLLEDWITVEENSFKNPLACF